MALSVNIDAYEESSWGRNSGELIELKRFNDIRQGVTSVTTLDGNVTNGVCSRLVTTLRRQMKSRQMNKQKSIQMNKQKCIQINKQKSRQINKQKSRQINKQKKNLKKNLKNSG